LCSKLTVILKLSSLTSTSRVWFLARFFFFFEEALSLDLVLVIEDIEVIYLHAIEENIQTLVAQNAYVVYWRLHGAILGQMLRISAIHGTLIHEPAQESNELIHQGPEKGSAGMTCHVRYFTWLALGKPNLFSSMVNAGHILQMLLPLELQVVGCIMQATDLPDAIADAIAWVVLGPALKRHL
jgi:hypothetical protein